MNKYFLILVFFNIIAGQEKHYGKKHENKRERIYRRGRHVALSC